MPLQVINLFCLNDRDITRHSFVSNQQLTIYRYARTLVLSVAPIK
ncbi:hypothetical protein MC7420_7221 [Coleofasciculus chthonoplastes PCC 7420]|uniref:Uncharacterized protein n=1 Tax=Coleofasciculus chthonoplastes PCC 7420 TaxID=118168 RepID=B4VHI7_9CYAN|nr:hypothetical protein [Coleofasciculus chthonoplastes]EDX78568.1 hypothetical protein MC7420_7221 [Coleofasciculus chthonoplastes PCC 7420]